MTKTPKNPLDLALQALEQSGIENPVARLYEATGRRIERQTLFVLKRPITARKVGAPRQDTREILDAGLAKLGVGPLDWGAFEAALVARRKKSDRRRKDVRAKMGLPAIEAVRAKPRPRKPAAA